MPPTDQKPPLADRTIGVPESRELDLFARMIEDRGGTVVRCPLIAIRDTPDSDTVEHWLAEVSRGGLDVMIWMTGEGVRRIGAFAERLDYREQLHAALIQTETITRGPKPVRALRELGLTTDYPAPVSTTDGVIDVLDDLELDGRRAGLQLYGQEPNHKLQQALREREASVLPIAPYVYADAAEDEAVSAFISRLIAGEMDGVALTSTAQVKRLLGVAARREQTTALIGALEATCVAAVGPLVADAIRQAGASVDLMPRQNYYLKPLVRALAAHFDETPLASRQ